MRNSICRSTFLSAGPKVNIEHTKIHSFCSDNMKTGLCTEMFWLIMSRISHIAAFNRNSVVGSTGCWVLHNLVLLGKCKSFIHKSLKGN